MDTSTIFKAYDIRGLVGSELTPAIAKRIGNALAQWLPLQGPVAVGRDMRPDSAELADALIEGIREQGRDVCDIGQVTSDMIYFAVGHYQLAGGAMITASHNPGAYNGIKLCREEAKPIGSESGLHAIQALLDTPITGETPGALTQKDCVTDWISHVLSFIDISALKPLHIAVDAGNGMAGKIFPALQEHVPFTVEQLYFELDGTFPHHVANPMLPEALVDIQQVISQKGCDAGLAFDGDGDRAVLLDEKGQPLSGTVLSALLAEHFLQNNPGQTVLLNAICGLAAYEMVEAMGGNAVRTRVGHSYIKADMREQNAIFAAEHSGHYYFKDNFMADSGLIAAVIGLAVLCESGQSLSELARPLREKYHALTETNFTVSDKQAVLEKLAETFASEQQDMLDGLTVRFADRSWFNVRPSNTEPLLRLNAEAPSKQRLNELTTLVTNILQG